MTQGIGNCNFVCSDMSPNSLESRPNDADSKYHMPGEMKNSVNYENVPLVHPNSPRTRIKTILPNKDLNRFVHYLVLFVDFNSVCVF